MCATLSAQHLQKEKKNEFSTHEIWLTKNEWILLNEFLHCNAEVFIKEKEKICAVSMGSSQHHVNWKATKGRGKENEKKKMNFLHCSSRTNCLQSERIVIARKRRIIHIIKPLQHWKYFQIRECANTWTQPTKAKINMHTHKHTNAHIPAAQRHLARCRWIQICPRAPSTSLRPVAPTYTHAHTHTHTHTRTHTRTHTSHHTLHTTHLIIQTLTYLQHNISNGIGFGAAEFEFARVRHRLHWGLLLTAGRPHEHVLWIYHQQNTT